MAVSMSPKQKVYQGVLLEIRKFIETNQLEPGDKLPSERELSEKLNRGRSSIREALRAMELLGLIETKHGEGTFLRSYQPYKTVELLASFILQDQNTRNDLLLVKQLLEKEAAKLAYSNLNEKNIIELNEISNHTMMEPVEKNRDFFYYLINRTDNKLLAKIWQLLDEFSSTIHSQYYPADFYTDLMKFYSNSDYEKIEPLFEKNNENIHKTEL
jgi:GntR family transcriptional repressor for pyruvate dehydrogenase complex